MQQADIALSPPIQFADERRKQEGADPTELRAVRLIYVDIRLRLMEAVETYRKVKQLDPRAIVLTLAVEPADGLMPALLPEDEYRVVHDPLNERQTILQIEEFQATEHGGLVVVGAHDPASHLAVLNTLISNGFDYEVVHTSDDAVIAARRPKSTGKLPERREGIMCGNA